MLIFNIIVILVLICFLILACIKWTVEEIANDYVHEIIHNEENYGDIVNEIICEYSIDKAAKIIELINLKLEEYEKRNP